jgi:ribonuclease-3
VSAGTPGSGELEAALGVAIDPELLCRALTHRSYAHEHGGLPTNERLEFLGDSVLGLVITDALYHAHPDLPESQLAKMRASVVNTQALAEIARGLGPGGLGAHLLLGRGELGTGGRDKDSLLADTLEAVLGAVYVDRGHEVARQVISRVFAALLAESAQRGAGLDWKTSLQELAAVSGLGVPSYVITEVGPHHDKTFTATAQVGGRAMGSGVGRTKKEAEKRAAETAWAALRDLPAERVGPAADGSEPTLADDG